MAVERIQVEGIARLPAFSHATKAGGFVYVSGSLFIFPASILLVEGVSGVGPITRFDTSDIRFQIACEIKNYEAKNFLSIREARRQELISLIT